jgi:DNA-binding beta-propeller fold protein YncE
MRLISRILTAVFLCTSALAQAAPIMTLVPNITKANLTPTTQVAVIYTLTNATAKDTLTGITLDPANAGGNPQGISLTADTCTGATLAPGASCTFDVILSGQYETTNFELSPRACVFNNKLCSQPSSANRVSVNVGTVRHVNSAYMVQPSANQILPIPVATNVPGTPITGFNFSTPLTPPPSVTGLAISTNGNTLYVANPGQPGLGIVNILGTPSVSTIDLTTAGASNSLSAVAVTPDQSQVYLADEGLGGIWTINPQTSSIGFVTPLPGVAARYIAVSPNGSIYYFLDIANLGAFAFNVGSNTSAGTPLGPLAQPSGLAISPDSSTVYISDATIDVMVLTDANLNFITSYTLPSPGPIALSPDGTVLYVALEVAVGQYIIAGIVPSTGTSITYYPIPLSQVGTLGLDPTGQYLYVTLIGSPDLLKFQASDLSLAPVDISLGEPSSNDGAFFAH